MRVLDPQHIHNDQVIPSSAPANVSDRQAPLGDQNDSWTPEDDGEEEEGDAIIRKNSQAELVYRKQREAESNKENFAEIPELQHIRTVQKRSIFDRAPLAERVSPIESQGSDHNGLENDAISDEGFQIQESSNAARQRHSKPATKRPAPEPARPKRQTPKKVRVRENVDVHTFNDRADASIEDQEIVLPHSQTYDEYTRVKESAREKMAVVTKPPQSRNAWTSKETDMLHYLITEHGTSWTHLKNEDGKQGRVLEARDQVALKDKARNMKMDYLKYVYKSNDVFSTLNRRSERVESYRNILSAFPSAICRSRD